VAVRTLATLLGAGVPLDRALGFAGDHAGHPEVAAALAATRRDVRAGATLGDAMRRQPAVFGALHVAMLAAGEAGGALGAAAARLADHLDESAELRAQLRAALLYPAVMSVVAGVGVTVLMLFVVPRFVGMLDIAGGVLPLSTRLLLATSRLVAGLWWLWVGLAVAGVAGGRAWLARPENRFRWHRRRLALPVAGRIERGIATARFTRTLGLASPAPPPPTSPSRTTWRAPRRRWGRGGASPTPSSASSPRSPSSSSPRGRRAGASPRSPSAPRTRTTGRCAAPSARPSVSWSRC
jgi:type II secretory pathway component PulF